MIGIRSDAWSFVDASGRPRQAVREPRQDRGAPRRGLAGSQPGDPSALSATELAQAWRSTHDAAQRAGLGREELIRLAFLRRDYLDELNRRRHGLGRPLDGELETAALPYTDDATTLAEVVVSAFLT